MLKSRMTTWKKALTIFVFLISVAWSFVQIGQAQAAERSRTEIEFDYILSKDKQYVIPRAGITQIDFQTGQPTTLLKEFPEKSWKIPANAQFQDNADASKTHILETTVDFPTLMNVSGKPKAYITAEYRLVAKTNKNKDAFRRHLIYELDLTTNQLSVLNSFEVTNPNSYAGIEILEYFQGYMLSRDASRKNYDNPPNEIYTFRGNKLLARRVDEWAPREQQKNGLIYLELENYAKETSKPRKDYPDRTSIVTTSNGTFIGRPFYLFEDGTRTETIPETQMSWEAKAGPYQYVVYNDSSTRLDRFGYRNGSKIQPLTDKDSMVSAHLSPDKRYIVVHESPRPRVNGKRVFDYTSNLLVFDTQTHKLLYRLDDLWPNTRGVIVQKFENDIVYLQGGVHKYNLYLHLPTGTLTRVLPNAKNFFQNSGITMGSTKGLISLQPPPAMYVNGKSVAFEGQGPFLTYQDQWYIESGDFAKAIGGTLKRTSQGVTITLRGKQASIANKEQGVIAYAGKTYIPLERLNQSFGVVAAFLDNRVNEARYRYDALSLFTSDVKPEDIPARTDAFTDLQNGVLFGKYYYEIQKGKPVTHQLTDTTGARFGNISLIFQGDKLLNAYGTLNVRTLRNVDFPIDGVAGLTKAYGTPKISQIGSVVIRWYDMGNSILLFECRGNQIDNAYTIIKH